MREFFGFDGYKRTPEGFLSWQHLVFVSTLMAIMIGLAVFLGLRNKNKEEKVKNKVLIWAAILIDGFELLKIIICCARDGSFEPILRICGVSAFYFLVQLAAYFGSAQIGIDRKPGIIN